MQRSAARRFEAQSPRPGYRMIAKTWRIAAVWLGLLLAIGCNAPIEPTPAASATPVATSIAVASATAPPSPTLRPTAMPSPTASVTRAPTATATPTRLPTLTATPTATPTEAPTATPTAPPATVTQPPPPTATPTAPAPTATAAPTAVPTADPAALPQVLYFRLARQPQRPSDSIALEWAVNGVSQVRIFRVGGEWGQANAEWDGAASGALMQSLPVEVGGWPIFYRLEGDGVTADFTITAPCEYDWVFAFPYPGGTCPTRAVTGRAAQQGFERGFMVWIAAQDVILYSTYDGLNFGELTDNYVEGVDPVNDPALVPPAGLYQPEYGFGKVWREAPGVRDLLGWATDWGSDYSVLRQSTPPHRYGWVEYISLRNGGLITINHPEPFWRIDYR